MKSARILFFASILFGFVVTLQLSSHRKEMSEQVHAQKGPRLYYPKHYLGHRSEAYKEKVREENKKKVEEFNQNNKKKLKAAGQTSEVTGGNSFALEENQFIEFTGEEFVKMFTGLNRPGAKHEHLHELKKDPNANHHEKIKTKSHQIFENHLLNKLTSQMEDHDQEVWSQNQQHNQEEEDQTSDQSWFFPDPYALNDSYIDSFYGDVNSEDNWGWNWKSFNKDYYDTQETNDFTNYWKDWELNHWGFDLDQSDVSALDELFTQLDSALEGNSNKWWKDWFGEVTQNKDNDSWWNLDDQLTTPLKPNNQTLIVQPAGPVTPIDLLNMSKPDIPINTDPGTTPLAAYPSDSMDVNWVIKGATTHVKEQGQCGSCWTFSAVGVIESYFLIKGLGRMDLSEQQLIDCQTTLSQGCKSGIQALALDYCATYGLVTEEKYPYRGAQQKCAHQTGPHKIPEVANVTGRAKMEEALRKGPITGGVFVDLHTTNYFSQYKNGIFDKCANGVANHAIVIVGFNKDYWIIRNSWGPQWGENGHMRIKRDQNNGNACSIQNESYGVLQ